MSKFISSSKAGITGIQAVNYAAQQFNTPLALPDEYNLLKGRKDQLEELRTEPAPNIAVDLANADDPEKILTAAVKMQARRQLIADNVQQAVNLVDEKIRWFEKSDDLLDYTLNQLDLDTLEADLIASATALGDLHDDDGAAIDAGLAQELTTFRQSMYRLMALMRLTPGKFSDLATVANIAPLPPLPYKLKSHGPENLYSKQDVAQHNTVINARQAARNEAWLIELAQGKHPEVGGLSLPRTAAEFRERQRIITNAGERTCVPKES